MTTNDDPRAVLDFWFGAPGSATDGQSRPEWFRKREDFDAEIAARFGALIEVALNDGLRDWASRPESALARILVLDQFTRNTGRGTSRAFAGDALALAAAREMLAVDFDAKLPPQQRAFVYLPFEHAEDLQSQTQSVRLFTRLADEAPTFAEMLNYARRHMEVIARFGRFPHRNAQLDRPSTAAELAFLEQPGSSF